MLLKKEKSMLFSKLCLPLVATLFSSVFVEAVIPSGLQHVGPAVNKHIEQSSGDGQTENTSTSSSDKSLTEKLANIFQGAKGQMGRVDQQANYVYAEMHNVNERLLTVFGALKDNTALYAVDKKEIQTSLEKTFMPVLNGNKEAYNSWKGTRDKIGKMNFFMDRVRGIGMLESAEDRLKKEESLATTARDLLNNLTKTIDSYRSANVLPAAKNLLHAVMNFFSPPAYAAASKKLEAVKSSAKKANSQATTMKSNLINHFEVVTLPCTRKPDIKNGIAKGVKCKKGFQVVGNALRSGATCQPGNQTDGSTNNTWPIYGVILGCGL